MLDRFVAGVAGQDIRELLSLCEGSEFPGGYYPFRG